MPEISYTIAKMKCQGCVDTISSTLQKIDGIELVDVNLESRAIKIRLDSSEKKSDLENALQNIGYPAIVNS